MNHKGIVLKIRQGIVWGEGFCDDSSLSDKRLDNVLDRESKNCSKLIDVIYGPQIVTSN